MRRERGFHKKKAKNNTFLIYCIPAIDMKKRGFRIFPKSMKSKHEWGDKVLVSGVYECSICGNYEAFKKGENFSECQDCINSKRTEDNKWYATNELIYFISKNINLEFDRITGISVKIADAITEYAGTVGFFLVHVVWFTLWIFANNGYFGPEYVFDTFPYGLLTMIVSLEAIFLSTFILMSQNVAAKKSEMRAEHEYQVNLETEKNVAEILAMVKDIRTEGNIRTEHIEDLKETVEEISEHIDIDEHKEDIKPKEIDEHVERHEKESFEEQEKLLDEIGIDIVPESAPPVILEEEEVIEREHLRKQEKDRKKAKSRRIQEKSSKRKVKSSKSGKTKSRKK